MKKIEELVTEFFISHGIYDEEQTTNTIINTIDLDYLDGIDIFEEFLKKFNIEKGYESFDINYFFYKLNFPDSFKSMLNIPIKKKYKTPPSITIAHMIEVAKRKEWFDPE